MPTFEYLEKLIIFPKLSRSKVFDNAAVIHGCLYISEIVILVSIDLIILEIRSFISGETCFISGTKYDGIVLSKAKTPFLTADKIYLSLSPPNGGTAVTKIYKMTPNDQISHLWSYYPFIIYGAM